MTIIDCPAPSSVLAVPWVFDRPVGQSNGVVLIDGRVEPCRNGTHLVRSTRQTCRSSSVPRYGGSCPGERC